MQAGFHRPAVVFMGDRTENNIEYIAHRLNDVRRRWKAVHGWKALVYGLTAIIAGTALSAVIEEIAWLSSAGRVISIGVVMLVAAFFIIKAGYRFISIFLNINKPDDVIIAGWVGDVFPEISDRLRNAVQLWRDEAFDKVKYSDQLRQEAVREAAEEIARVDSEKAVNPQPLYDSLKIFILSAVVSIPIILFAAGGGFHRVVHPFTVFHKPLPFAILVDPGDITVIEGDTLQLTAEVQGGSPEELYFHLYPSVGEKESEDLRMVPRGRDDAYRLQLAGVNSSFHYKVSAKGVETRIFAVEVKKLPMVLKLRVKLNPPAYSNFPPMSLSDNVGDILALAGTEVEFNIAARGEIERAFLVWECVQAANDTVVMKGIGNEFSASKKAFAQGKYYIKLFDREGLDNRFPITYYVDILPDLPPVVDIVQPGVDLEISAAGGLKLLMEGEDDFGLSKMNLKYRRKSEFAPEADVDFQNIALKFHQDVDGVFRADYLWDLTQLGLIPGDVVEYYAEAADNDNISGPKLSQSSIYIIRLPTMAEMFAEMEQAEKEGLEELKKSLEQSREIHEEVEKAINEMRRKGELDWSQKRNLEENIQSHQEVIEKLEKTKEALENIMQMAEEGSLLSLELLEKYDELQQLLSEIASPELMKALEQLSNALDEVDPEKLRQAAENFQLSQEEMLKNIEKSLQILKQLKLERQLEELAERAAEMAERQSEINEQLQEIENEDISNLATQENALQSDMENWLEKLEEAQRSASELDSITASELKDAREDAVIIPEEMENMSDAMMSEEKESASQQGEGISRKLSQLSFQMSEIKSGMISRQKAELAGKMMEAVGDLIALSKLQEGLKQESGQLPVRSARFREGASMQSGLAEALEEVIDRLFELSQQTFFVTPEIGRSLGNAAGMMRNALDGYTARNPRNVAAQQNSAMGAMNKAASRIMDAVSQMESSSSATGFNELMERLQQMAGQQAGLNEQTQSMMMPMPGGGGLSMEQMAAMGRLAAEQRALQQAMDEAAQQAQQMGGVLGDLGEISQQMGQVADSLEDMNVGERTLKMQERILSRLLDAQRSVRTQRISKERKSKVGEDIVHHPPGAIPEDELEEMMRQDILRAMKEGYAPEYQRLIKEYYRSFYQFRVNKVEN